jgi:transposase
VCEQIKHLDALIAEAVEHDERAKRLTTVPSIGPVTALSFVALVDNIRALLVVGQALQLSGLGTTRVQLWREAATRSHHQAWRLAFALSTRRVRVGDIA